MPIILGLGENEWFDPLGISSMPGLGKPVETKNIDAAAAKPAMQVADAATPVKSTPKIPPQEFDKAVDVLIGEALGEGPDGMAAVASVIKNRSAIRHKSIGEVIAEPDQFSPPGEATLKAMRDPKIRAEAGQILTSVLDGEIADPTKGADHYHADYVSPRWASKMQETTAIGRHKFYTSGKKPAQADDGGIVVENGFMPKDDLGLNSGADPFKAVLTDQSAVAGDRNSQNADSVVQNSDSTVPNPAAVGLARLVRPDDLSGPKDARPGSISFVHKGQGAIDPGFKSILEGASSDLGRPLVVTSGFRSPSHPVEAAKARPGEHSKHTASDISMSGLDDAARAQLVDRLISRGAKRFITYTNEPDMLHVDMKDQLGDGKPYFMHDRSARNLGRAPGWFKTIASGEYPVPGSTPAYVEEKPPAANPAFEKVISKGADAQAIDAGAADKNAIVVDGTFKPADNMGLYKDANPFVVMNDQVKSAADANEQERRNQAAGMLNDPAAADTASIGAKLEAEAPGRYQVLDESDAAAFQQQWEKDNRSTGAAGDAKRNFLAQNAQIGVQMDEAVRKIPGVGNAIADGMAAIDEWVTGKPMKQRLSEYTEQQLSSTTPEDAAAREKKAYDPSKSFYVGDALKDPRWYLAQVSGSAPAMAVTMVPGGVLARASYMKALAAGMSERQAAAAAAKTATLSGSLSEGTLTGAQSSLAVKERIAALPRETLLQSEAVKALISQGLSEDDAVKAVTEDAATQAFIYGGVAGGIFGGMGDRVLAKIIAEGVGGTVAQRLAKGVVTEGVAEGLEEGAQNAGQTVGENKAMQTVDPNQSLTEGLGESVVAGTVTGTAMGAPIGGIAAVHRHSADATAVEDAASEQAASDPAAVDSSAATQADAAPPADAVPPADTAAQPPIKKGGLAEAVQAGRQRAEEAALKVRRPLAVPDGMPPPGSTVMISSDGVEFMGTIDSWENGEAVVLDSQTGEVLQVPSSAIKDVMHRPGEPIMAEDKRVMPPAEEQKRAIDTMSGLPDPGGRVVVASDGVERFPAKIESYEGADAIVKTDDGKVMQVPVGDLTVSGLTKKQVEVQDLAANPPVERDQPEQTPTLRKVANRNVNLPDERHARLYDLGQERMTSRRLIGKGSLDMDKVMPAEQRKLAAEFGITSEALGQMADDYRYRVERVGKEARSDLPVKMYPVNEKRLKQWQDEAARAKKKTDIEADVPTVATAQVEGATASGPAGIAEQDSNRPDGPVAAPVAADVVTAAAHEAATSPHNDLPEPSQAQKEAGNYKLGHVRLGGLDISVENPEGSVRKGKSRSGKPWEVEMKSHYGYIKGTVGKDKDHIDVFVRPGATDIADDAPVYVVDQRDPARGRFDEHKVMLGWDTQKAARDAYLANYSKGWKGLGAVTQTTLGEFKQWLATGDTKTAFAPKWFPAKEKAQAYIDSEKLGDRYEVVPDGLKFEVKRKQIVAKAEAVDTSQGGPPRPPSRVYHGTSTGGFDSFDTYGGAYGLFGSGGYFTEDPSIATEYTRKGKGKQPTVYSAHLNVKNPLDMDAPADVAAWEKAFPDYLDASDVAHLKNPTNEQVYRAVEDNLSQEMIPDYEGAETMQDGVRGMGYDAVTHIGGGRHKSSRGNKHRVWIVFDEDQVTDFQEDSRFYSKPESTTEENLPERAGGKFEPDWQNVDWDKAEQIIQNVAGDVDVGWQGIIRIADGSAGWGIPDSFEAAGIYDTVRDAITLSKEFGTSSVAYHEAFHRLQNLFITKDERDLLKLERGRLRRIVASERGAEQASQMSQIELEAEAFAIYASRGDEMKLKPPAAIRAVWNKILELVRRLHNFLVGFGFTTTEDVFDRAKSGEMKDRAPHSEGNLLVGKAYTPANRVRDAGIPSDAASIHTFRNDTSLKAHPDYKAAKAGDFAAAIRMVPALVKPENIAAAAKAFGADVVYVAAHAAEASGNNAIPIVTAHYYADSTGAEVDPEVVQISRAYHTGAKPTERLVARAYFDGPIKPGQKYVLVDDVTVMGSTLADLANFVQKGGGQVVGTVTLVNAARDVTMAADKKRLNEIERRFGDVVRTELQLDPQSLTRAESDYLLNFRDADALRNRIAASIGERRERLGAKGVPAPQAETGKSGVDDGKLYSVAPRRARDRTITENRVVSEVRGKLTDLTPALLGAVPLNYFPELKRPNMTAVDDYMRVKRAMDAYRGNKHAEADEIAQEWLRYTRLGFLGKDKPKAKVLSDLMHDTTLAGIDPSLTDDETKAKPGYAELRKRYLAVAPAGRALYEKVRDAYKKQAEELDKILLDNVRKAMQIEVDRAEAAYNDELTKLEKSGLKGNDLKFAKEKAAADYRAASTRANWSMKARLTKLRLAFESSRVEAPYFPLGRFGKYFVSVRDVDGTIQSFSKFEKAADRDRAAAALRKSNPTSNVTAGLMEDKDSMRGAMDPRIIAEIETILGNANVDDAVLDAVWQRYLESMPDLSTRKRFIHRSGTAGFNEDALRVFSNHMFHASHQMGRTKYGMELQELVNKTRDQANQADDQTRGMTLANELTRRHAWVMNPTGSSIAQIATSSAFIWMLAVSPAASLVNLSQTIMLGVPILAARHGGMLKASAAILKASRDFVAGRGHAGNANISADEKQAMEAFYESGLIDRTQSHDLAGVGETGVKYSPARAKVMSLISWGFHQTERANREVTALAAYRLARQSGMSQSDAIDAAHDSTYKTHFDFSNSSRPRYMQNDFMKVALVFRSYQVNMNYRMFRDLHQTLKGETPQVRKEARYQLAGVLGMQALLAGVTGVAGFHLALGLASLVFGDDDDPMDFETQFKADVIKIFGPELGGIILNGAPGHYTGVDLTARIGMPDLWFRSPGRELQGKEEYQYWVSQMLGAVPSIGERWYQGASVAMEGDVARGIEIAAPKFVGDLMKAYRYANEGLTNLKGDEIVPAEDIDVADILKQAIGFTPAGISEAWDRKSALENAETRIKRTRQVLVNRFALAVAMGDNEARAEAVAAIKKYNAGTVNRTAPITSDTLRASLKTRARNAAKREDGALIETRALGKLLRENLPARVYD